MSIIGNPPYVRIQTLPKDQVVFFSKNFVSATGNYDIYTLFVEQGLKLLKPGGILGFILPHKFFQAAYGQGLRKLISDQNVFMEVVNFRDNQIFEQASTYTCSAISPEEQRRHIQIFRSCQAGRSGKTTPNYPRT